MDYTTVQVKFLDYFCHGKLSRLITGKCSLLTTTAK